MGLSVGVRVRARVGIRIRVTLSPIPTPHTGWAVAPELGPYGQREAASAGAPA